ncbi:MAG: class I SAM-dependent methyltransferase [Candidatus Omnitrophota bacterium]
MMSCNACNSNNSRLIFKKNGQVLLKCAACGLVFREVMPTESQLSALYTEALFKDEARLHYYIEDQLTNALNARANSLLVRQHKKEGRILDVGSAFGSFLETMERQGWDVWGNELSRFAAEYTQGRVLGRVTQGDFLAADLPRDYFDAVTMWDFIEHVPNPFANLAKANELLKKGGLLFISTGDIGSMLARILGEHWKLLKPDQHLFYFGYPSIQRLLERAGFSVVAKMHRGRYFNFEYLLRSSEQEYKNKAVRIICRVLLRVKKRLRLLPPRIYINLGDIMTVVAMKLKQ